MFFFIPESLKQKLGFGIKINPAYSDHQQKVIANFGEPDAFKLLMNLDGPRRETWFYYQLGEAFVFEDGHFLARSHQDFDIKDSSDLIIVKYEPADFYEMQAIPQLVDLVGAEPNYSGEINSKLLENAQFYSFVDALDVGVVDDQVVFVRTKAFVLNEEAKNNSASQNTTQTISPTLEPEGSVARVDSVIVTPDDMFSIDAGVLANDMTVAIEE
ncbi:MAG: hypothetical protein GF390_00655, partial [Candidatus Pacebacteria bacterium]|nr:hypothetical protein [Candidatus Paceibacterota bacterium]